MDANVEANTEVLGHEGGHVVTLEHHLALEEGSLGHAGVLDLGFDDHDRFILEEVVDEHFVVTVVLKTRFDN